MFIFEILIYTFFALIMCSIAKKSYTSHQNSPKIDKFLWCYIGFYVFICAIRYGVGVDSISYAHNFKYGEYGSADQNEGEILWHGFIMFIVNNGFHFTVGMGLCAFLQIFPITKALAKQKYALYFMPIALFGSFYFLSLNNGVRQMIVASWFLYATKWIVNRSWWKYLLFIVVAHYIHTSSIILAPLYFLPSVGNLSSKRKICVSILLICLIIGITPQFQFLNGKFDNLMLMIGYASYTDQLTDIMLGLNENKQSFGLQKMSYFIGFLAITFFGKELNEKYGNENKCFNIWWFYAFVYGCLYFLVGGMSFLFQRPLMYIELFTLLMLSFLMHYLVTSKKCFIGIRTKAIYVLLIISIWISIGWTIIKAQEHEEFSIEHATYKTIFNHEVK